MRVAALRGILGACCAVLGTGILAAPQYFHAATPGFARPWRGIALLLIGLGVLGLPIVARLVGLLAGLWKGTRDGASGRERRRSPSVLEAAVQILPQAVIVLRVDGKVAVWNAAAERLFGWGAQETLGRPLPFVLGDGEPGALDTGGATPPLTKAGSPIEVTVTASPLHDPKGRVTGQMLVIEDSIDHARTERLKRSRAGLLAGVNAITDAASSAPDLSRLLERVIDNTLEALGLEAGCAWLGETSVLRELGPEAWTAVAHIVQSHGDRPGDPIRIVDCQAAVDAEPAGAGALARLGFRALLIAPFSAQAGRTGGLAVMSAASRDWAPDEVVLVETLGRHLAETAHSLRAFQETRDRLHLQSHVMSVSKVLSRLAPLAEVVKTIGEAALSLGKADRAAVYLRQPNGAVVCPWSQGLSEAYVAQVARYAQAIAAGHITDGANPDLLELTGRGIDGAAPALYGDVTALPHGVAVPKLTQVEGYRALANWPLTREGDVLGLVSCYYNAPRTWTEAEQELFRVFYQEAADAIYHGRLYDEQAQRAADLEVLFALSRRLRGAQNPEAIYRILVAQAMELLRAEKGVLNLLDPKEQVFHCVYAVGLPAEVRDAPFPISGSAFGRAVETGTTYRTANFGGEPLPIWLNGYRSIGPAVVVPLRSESEIIGTLSLGRPLAPDAHPFADPEVRLLEGVAEIGGTAIRRARLFQSLENSYMQMVLSLARTMDARDHYTSGHSERIAVWAEEVARALNCSEAEVQEIRWGALLHDIGKIGVPDEILRKPAKLTEEEWVVMRRHPVIGEEILASTERMRGVASVVRHHQEKWNGSGYPDRLRGDEIPLGARILAVVDAYSAITDDRPYKKARSHEEAIAELHRCAGTHFDPQVVEVFCRVVEQTRAKAGKAR